MDELTGLSFSINSNPSRSSNTSLQSQRLAQNNSPAFPSLRPNSATPPSFPSRTNSPAKFGSNSQKQVTDSFATLVSFGKNKDANSNLSLLERQRRMEAERAMAEEEKQKQLDAQYGGGSFWDAFDKQQTTAVTPPLAPASTNKGDDDDLFAAFNANAPVDRTSHFPPPSSIGNSAHNSSFGTSRLGTPAPVEPNGWNGIPIVNKLSKSDLLQDDDDPFDLPKPASHTAPFAQAITQEDEDDLLGLLGKPISEARNSSPAASLLDRHLPPPASGPPPTADPRDGAIAEIMDMGFSTEQAKEALAHTDTGLDIQQAVGWLLEQAHRKAKAEKYSISTPTLEKPQRDNPKRTEPLTGYRDRTRGRPEADQKQPAWMRERSGDNIGEKDFTKIASEVGTNLFKSANSLWNQSRKKVTEAIEEFQHDKSRDDGVPKWMRDAHESIQRPITENNATMSTTPARNTRREAGVSLGIDNPEVKKTESGDSELTEEALMLEMGSGAQKPPNHLEPKTKPPKESKNPFVKRMSPVQAEIASQRQRQMELEAAIRRKEQEMREQERQRGLEKERGPHLIRRDKLTKEAIESEVVYISPARRKKTPIPATPSRQPIPPVGISENLLDGSTVASEKRQSRNPFLQMQQSSHTQETQLSSQISTPKPITKNQPSLRTTVDVSASAISSSNISRTAGTEAYKIGDYSKALTHYSSALTPLPSKHPLRILLLANRAICHLKVGDPKSCIVDTEEALSIIGDGKGEGETISLGSGEPEKNMKEMWGKVMCRKAEALEQLEKWNEAFECWCRLVESGCGGPNAIQGKRRCETALNPKPKGSSDSATAPTTSPSPNKLIAKSSQVSTVKTITVTHIKTQTETEAITRLRATNLAAEQAEAERLALLDSVNEKIQNWKGGREGNLRALLVSLDSILWPEAGWKKIGMHELVVASKVKVAYMRGIGKVHPDKIPTNATTQQRMICAAAFSLLNEAWEKFKVENKL